VKFLAIGLQFSIDKKSKENYHQTLLTNGKLLKDLFLIILAQNYP